MKKTFARLFFLIFALSLLMSVFSLAKTQKKVIRVGYTSVTGISEVDEHGNRSGIIYDYLVEISKYTNWEYEFVDGTVDDLIEQLKTGKIDLLGGVYQNEATQAMYRFSKYSIGSNYSALLARNEDDTLQGYDLRTLNQKTIAVNAMATEKIHYLSIFLQQNNLECKLKEFANPREYENAYHDPEVDLLLGSDINIPEGFRMVAHFPSNPYFFATALDNEELMNDLDHALSHILETNVNFFNESYQENFSAVSINTMTLSAGEKAFIAQAQPVKVALVNQWHPFYCPNSNHIHRGIVPDTFDLLAKRTGLTFTYVYADTYAESLQMVRNGEADVASIYLGNDKMAQSMGLVLTKDYVQLNKFIIKNKSVSYPSAGLTAALQEGEMLPSSMEADKVNYYPTLTKCIEAVNRGEADFTIGISSTVESILQRKYYANLNSLSTESDKNGIAMAMLRPVNSHLFNILNKAINNFTDEEINKITLDNSISPGTTDFSLMNMIYANPVAFLVIFGAIILLIVMILLIIVRSRMKNALIQTELERIEAASKAKSDFLSRMSHEIRTPMNAIIGLTDLALMSHETTPEIQGELEKIQSSSKYLLSLINDILDMSRIESGKMEIVSEPFSLQKLFSELQTMLQTQAESKGITCAFPFEVEHGQLIGDEIRLRQVLTNLVSNALKFTDTGGSITVSAREQDFSEEEQTVSIFFSVKDNGVGIAPENLKRIFGAFEQVGTSTSNSAGTGLGLPISQNIVRLMGSQLQVKSQLTVGSEFYFTITFPVGEPETQPVADLPPEQTNVQLEGMHILLAEDNDLNAEIAISLLELKGISVIRALNGQEAVEIFREKGPQYFDAILMDLQMPVKNGLEATREIRALNCPGASAIPIIAMTANSFQKDVNDAKQAGMNDFIPKPVDVNLLYQILSRIGSDKKSR